MFALTRLVEGLLVFHLFLVVAYLVGSNATFSGRIAPLTPPQALVRLTCTCALGFALIGFGAFLLGMVGLFDPVCVAAMLPITFLVGCALARVSPFSRSYWRERVALLSSAVDACHVALYYLMLVLAMPAVNRAEIGADAAAYHWAYAVDWIQAGRIVVDPFLRIPFYAHNVLLVEAVLMIFGATVFVPFFAWGASLLMALGLCAASRVMLADRVSTPWGQIIGVSLALAVVVSPTYLRWSDSGYLDPLLGMLMLFTIMPLQVALEERSRRWLFVAAVVGAFLVGSKASFIALLPAFAWAVVAAGRSMRLDWKGVLPVLGVLLVLSAPWYLRNLVEAGDPIAPVLNLALHGSDGIDSKDDEQVVLQDIGTDRSPAGLVLLPVSLFLHPDARRLSEFQNALVLLLYVPLAIVLWRSLFLGRTTSATVVIPTVLLMYLIGYWWASASLLRYALLFFPVLALCCAAAASAIPLRKGVAGPVFAIIAMLTLVITPSKEAVAFCKEYWRTSIVGMPAGYTSDEAVLKLFVEGYAEAEFSAKFMHAHHVDGRIYSMATSGASDLNYYFRASGIASVGDWVGPAGYFRLYRAVDARRAAEFMADLHVNAVLINPDKGVPAFAAPLGRQLVDAGFCRIAVPQSKMDLYVRSRKACPTTLEKNG